MLPASSLAILVIVVLPTETIKLLVAGSSFTNFDASVLSSCHTISSHLNTVLA